MLYAQLVIFWHCKSRWIATRFISSISTVASNWLWTCGSWMLCWHLNCASKNYVCNIVSVPKIICCWSHRILLNRQITHDIQQSIKFSSLELTFDIRFCDVLFWRQPVPTHNFVSYRPNSNFNTIDQPWATIQIMGPWVVLLDTIDSSHRRWVMISNILPAHRVLADWQIIYPSRTRSSSFRPSTRLQD